MSRRADKRVAAFVVVGSKVRLAHMEDVYGDGIRTGADRPRLKHRVCMDSVRASC